MVEKTSCFFGLIVVLHSILKKRKSRLGKLGAASTNDPCSRVLLLPF